MRSAQAQAHRAANDAGSRGSTLFGEGQAQQATLFPFLRGELGAEHAFTPTQMNEMLSYAGAGAGGATAGMTGQAALNAARTRNSAGFQASLDRLAQQRQQGLAKASEGIGAEDARQTLANKQAAAKGLEGLYGANTDAALKAMGIQSQDINDEIQAGKSGWFQNMLGLMNGIKTPAFHGFSFGGGE